ncbi:hypothetical protein RA276_30920, partial [Pseudomonas syringae pv. tagetis]
MRAGRVPVSLRDLLELIIALDQRVFFAVIDEFYFLARSILVKSARHFDKLDRAFGAFFYVLDKLDYLLQALI